MQSFSGSGGQRACEEATMRVLISACLLGVSCRYDGASKPHSLAAALARCHELVPVCPEQLGGLATPRPPQNGKGTVWLLGQAQM